MSLPKRSRNIKTNIKKIKRCTKFTHHCPPIPANEGQGESVGVVLGVLLVLQMAAFLGEGDKVRKDHASEADMIKRFDGVCLDVLGVVVVHASLDCLLHRLYRQHRLDVVWELLQLQPLHLAVESPQRHFLPLISLLSFLFFFQFCFVFLSRDWLEMNQ
uniref:Uncharacterized protein n=1 Tax=Rhizophora mucronata TaxID=61149 RepID=A0A2P2IP11_RHIMU